MSISTVRTEHEQREEIVQELLTELCDGPTFSRCRAEAKLSKALRLSYSLGVYAERERLGHGGEAGPL